MKNIILSFDDSRADMYYYAYPILRKYNLTATINVISHFVLTGNHKTRYDSWTGSMTPSQLRECKDYGMEIASHGSEHDNQVSGIKKSIEELKEMKLIESVGGGYWICESAL